MKKETSAHREAGHSVVGQRLGDQVDGVSIVQKEGSTGDIKLPNPIHRRDPYLERHRIWVEHAAVIALAGAAHAEASQSALALA